MATIFGEENFFNKEMAKLYKAQDEYIYNEMSMAIKTYMPTVVFDRGKLEKWVKLCVKLDNIDNTDLIDMATQKKFEELKSKLKLTEKALELSCEEMNRIEAKYGFAYLLSNDCLVDYFKTKAKEKMKSE